MPRADAPEEFAAEFDQWLDQKQIRLFNPAHYPLRFDTQDDLIWFQVARENPSEEKKSQPNQALETETPRKKKRRSKKRRRKIPQSRICVCFHTVRDLKFEVYCDRRQLPYFKQFLSDYEAYKSKNEKFSSRSFLFRSATVFWVKDETLHREMKRQQRKQAKETDYLPELPPWKTHRLYLHVAIDDEQLTAEGTERVRQESLKKYEERLQRSEDKLNKLEDEYKEGQQQRPLTAAESKKIKDQRSSVKRTRTTIERLTKTTLRRPGKPPYQGQKNRAMAVSFDRRDPVTIAVVDQLHLSAQFHCSTEELLIYHRARIKVVNRNVRLFKLKPRRRIPVDLEYKLIHYLSDREAVIFLLGRNYQLERTGHTILWTELQYQLLRVAPVIAGIPVLLLLNLDTKDVTSDYQTVKKLHEQHKERVNKRAQDQKLKHRYRKDSTESNTREYLARVIAAAIVKLAIELQVGAIVVPDLSNIREKVEAQIRAEAEREHPNNYEAQNNYAKATRASFHRWNYSQLATFIQERARKDGLAIAIMSQPTEGTLTEKASKMATEFRSEHLLQAPN
jgi:IS605 OrfB family transposase